MATVFAEADRNTSTLDVLSWRHVVETQDTYRRLIETEACTLSCLAALQEDGDCTCRCGDAYHGKLWIPEDELRDPFRGWFVHVANETGDGYARQGEVVKEMPNADYFVEWFSFWDGTTCEAGIYSQDEMKSWTHYTDHRSFIYASWRATDKLKDDPWLDYETRYDQQFLRPKGRVSH